MRRTAMVILLFFLPALSNLRAEKVDNRNFAIDTYYPTPNEINLAETRARRYCRRMLRALVQNRFISLWTQQRFSLVRSSRISGRS
jgi:hypothetical protein